MRIQLATYEPFQSAVKYAQGGVQYIGWCGFEHDLGALGGILGANHRQPRWSGGGGGWWAARQCVLGRARRGKRKRTANKVRKSLLKCIYTCRSIIARGTTVVLRISPKVKVVFVQHRGLILFVPLIMSVASFVLPRLRRINTFLTLHSRLLYVRS
jgi:hypothetical protein